MKIALTGGLAARFFGVPFLAVGGYLAYELAGGIADLLVGRAAIAEMFAGTVLLLIMTGAFLIPGWLLTLSRAHVEIDPTARTVTYGRDFRVTQWRQVRSLSEFDRVEVDLLSVSSSHRSNGKRAYQVELAADDRSNVLVGLFDDGEDALAFGHRLGASIDLRVDDLRGVEPETDE
jgi:hypothetical protein